MAIPKILTAILIDPYERTVKVVEIPNTLESYYKAIGCSLIEAAYIFGPGADFCYVDEEGMFGGQSCGFETIAGNRVLGRGLVLRSGRNGGTISTGKTLDQVRDDIVHWIGEPDIDVDALVEEELLNANPLFGRFG